MIPAYIFFRARCVALCLCRAAASLVVPLLLAAPGPAAADIQIVYVAENLTDTTPGEDLWRYTYTVSGRTFLESEGFRVFFPNQLFQAFDPPGYPDEQWDAFVVPADEFLPEQLLAAQARAGITGQWLFSVEFLWLGRATDTPGSQRYELFDPDFVTLDPPGTLGTVAQVIPEPQTGALVLTGLALLATLSMRRRVVRSQRPREGRRLAR